MSLSFSINRYNMYGSTQAANSVTDRQYRFSTSGSSTKSQEASSDSVQFSQLALQYWSTGQSQTADSTEELGLETGKIELTMEQKKSILANLQSKLNSLDSSSELTDESDATLSALKEELSDFDVSSTTDEQVANLFAEVEQTIQSAGSQLNGDSLMQGGSTGGLPPMMAAMGGIVPPFAWNFGNEGVQQTGGSVNGALTTEQTESISSDLQSGLSSLDSHAELTGEAAPPPPPPPIFGAEDANSQDSDTTQSELTTEQKKEILSELQEQLNSTDSSDELSSLLGETYAALKDQLAGFDASSATDDQVSALFDAVTEKLQQSSAIAEA